MNSQVSFGVGCFHFGCAGEVPFEFSGSKYISDLRRALESLPSVDNLDIYCDDEFKQYHTQIDERPPKLSSGRGFFPNPLFMDVTFEIRLPFRVQESLVRSSLGVFHAATERFRVWIHYTYHFPVTFVQPMEASEPCEPSEAVVIIREFLSKEIGDQGSVLFECLGPSPFHADFYIECAAKVEDKNACRFSIKRTPDDGYDRIIVEHKGNCHSTPQEVMEVLGELLADELGFYYEVQQAQVARWHDWSRVAHFVERLTDMHRVKGFKSVLQRMGRVGRLVNETILSLTEFEVSDISESNAVQRDYVEIFGDGQRRFLRRDVKMLIDGRHSYPVHQTRELLGFFETRRTKCMDIVALLGAAVLGGAVGAAFTALIR